MVMPEFNFEHDQVAQYIYYARRTWDHDEQAWAVRRRQYDNATFGTSVYVPAGVTVRVSCEVKIESVNNGQPVSKNTVCRRCC